MTGLGQSLGDERRTVGPAAMRLLGDERLARLATAGDERAFAAIYRRYGTDLHRYCRAILGNPDDAADALQNTMVSALRSLPGEHREIALKPWLFRVAHNEAISLLRARRPVAELDPDQLVAPAADTDAVTAERLRQLVRDLGRLADRQRGALIMRELSGLSFDEIGATLGCSPAAGRQTVYEARLALQEMADGREMECELARRAVSERDGRVRRGRKLRAHLRDCERCAAFATAIDERRENLAALAPALAVPAAIGLLGSVSAGTAGTGSAVGGSVAIKSAAAVLAVAALGAGAGGVGGLRLPGFEGSGDKRTEATAPPAPPRAASGPAGGVDRLGTPTTFAPANAGRDGPQARSRGHSERPPGHARSASGRAAAPPGQDRRPATPPGQAKKPPGQAHSPPVQGLAPAAPTPPGQAGALPGQVSTPQRQVPTTPPGQADAPADQVATTPGQTGPPPGQAQK
jgi:RNA polymerase sigma factor (sigma-70 family)